MNSPIRSPQHRKGLALLAAELHDRDLGLISIVLFAANLVRRFFRTLAQWRLTFP